MKDNGNISKGQVERDETEAIQAGDYVRIKPDEMDGVEMSPKAFLNIGHPNEFFVIGTFEHKGELCLTIEECCERLKNRATGQFLCTGHQAKYFEKTDPIEHRRTSERRLLAIEGFGVRASVEYLGGHRKLMLKTPWFPDGISLSGEIAKNIAEAAKAIDLF